MVPGEWIAWAGGECPVPPSTYVQVRLECDSTEAASAFYPARSAEYWANSWGRKRSSNRIIAYRVVTA